MAAILSRPQCVKSIRKPSWRHDIDAFPVFLSFCDGNLQSANNAVIWIRLNQQSACRWFRTPQPPWIVSVMKEIYHISSNAKLYLCFRNLITLKCLIYHIIRFNILRIGIQGKMMMSWHGNAFCIPAPVVVVVVVAATAAAASTAVAVSVIRGIASYTISFDINAPYRFA